MDSAQIVPALGKDFESAEVQILVRALQSKHVPRAKRDDPDAYVEAKRDGVALMFVDDDYINRRRVAAYGNAPMVLVSATLYTGSQDKDPSYSRFMGSLPGGVAFTDPIESLGEKLGDPSLVYESKGIVFTRQWRRDNVLMTFKYNKAGVLQYVQLIWDAYMKRMNEG